VWRDVRAYEGAKDKRNFGESGGTLVNKLLVVEQRRLKLKARLASRVVCGYRNEGVQVGASKGGA